MEMTHEEKSDRMEAVASLMDAVANARTEGLVTEVDAKKVCSNCVANALSMLSD